MSEILSNDVFNSTPLTEARVREMNPQSIAFVGDAVHSLFVRTNITSKRDSKSFALHRITSCHVNAKAQADKIDKIFDSLTENEQYMFKRGRNVKTANSAKNASMTDYHKATGFECLLGYLYLTGNFNRLKEILDISEDK